MRESLHLTTVFEFAKRSAFGRSDCSTVERRPRTAGSAASAALHRSPVQDV